MRDEEMPRRSKLEEFDKTFRKAKKTRICQTARGAKRQLQRLSSARNALWCCVQHTTAHATKIPRKKATAEQQVLQRAHAVRTSMRNKMNAVAQESASKPEKSVKVEKVTLEELSAAAQAAQAAPASPVTVASSSPVTKCDWCEESPQPAVLFCTECGQNVRRLLAVRCVGLSAR
jgi:hypothetical protein